MLDHSFFMKRKDRLLMNLKARSESAFKPGMVRLLYLRHDDLCAAFEGLPCDCQEPHADSLMPLAMEPAPGNYTERNANG